MTIFDTLKQKSVQPKPTENTGDIFSTLKAKASTTPNVSQETPNRSVFGTVLNVAKDIARPVVTMAARPFQLGKALAGATPEEQAVNIPGFGRIESPQTGSDVIKDVGRGLETVSLGVGGGAVKAGFKQVVKKGAVEGAKSGALFGAGQALEEKGADTSIEDIASKTAVGGVLGGAFGAAIPAAIGGVSKIKQKGFGGAFQSSPEKVIQKRTNTLQRLEDNNVRMRNYVSKQKDRGFDPKTDAYTTDLLVDSVDNTGTIRTKQEGGAVSRYTEAIKNDEGVVTQAIKREGRSVPLKDVEKRLIASVNNSGVKGASRTEAMSKVAREIEGYKMELDPTGQKTVDEIMMPVSDVHSAKIDKYANVNYLNENGRVDKAIAKTLKKIVEENTASVDVAALNEEMSKHYANIGYLEKLDGAKVEGGRLGKHFARTIGAIAGSHFGPLGTIAGAELAGGIKGADMSRTFGKTLGKDVPRSDLMKQSAELAKTTRLPVESVGGKNKIPFSTPGFRKLPVKEIPSDYKDRFYTPDKKLPVIDAGKTPKTEDNLPTIKFAEKDKAGDLQPPKVYSQSFGKRNAIQQNVATADKTANKTSIDKSISEKPKRNMQGGYISTGGYKETGNLTTTILKDLEGKTTVSRQYIMDATNRGELKQVERDLIREILETEKGDTIDVAKFAEKVKSELLPLKRVNANTPIDDYASRRGENYGQRYEGVTLPKEIRGNVANYSENIYESPIKTSAGDVHFDDSNAKNYFGHTRTEDLSPSNAQLGNARGNAERMAKLDELDKTRRVIEIQSDLYQKGNLERELNVKPKNYPSSPIQPAKEGSKRYKEVEKLKQYNDPTAHFRMIREEMRQAAIDGKTKLQFPTGETAMKIEGLGETTRWFDADTWTKYIDSGDTRLEQQFLTKDKLKIGMDIVQANNVGRDDNWIVTEVLGDGKFKAIPSRSEHRFKVFQQLEKGEDIQKYLPKDIEYEISGAGGVDNWLEVQRRLMETFDISGKVDTSNPIYKFYEKEVQRYLQKFGGKRITDAQGVDWIEVPITKEMKGPVTAFGKVATSPLFLGAGASAVAAVGSKVYSERKSNFGKK